MKSGREKGKKIQATEINNFIVLPTPSSLTGVDVEDQQILVRQGIFDAKTLKKEKKTESIVICSEAQIFSKILTVASPEYKEGYKLPVLTEYQFIVSGHGRAEKIGLGEQKDRVTAKELAASFGKMIPKEAKSAEIQVTFHTCNSAYFTNDTIEGLKKNKTIPSKLSDADKELIHSTTFIGQFRNEMLERKFKNVTVKGLFGFSLGGQIVTTHPAQTKDKRIPTDNQRITITAAGAIEIPKKCVLFKPHFRLEDDDNTEVARRPAPNHVRSRRDR
jgi:hypothetical protein